MLVCAPLECRASRGLQKECTGESGSDNGRTFRVWNPLAPNTAAAVRAESRATTEAGGGSGGGGGSSGSGGGSSSSSGGGGNSSSSGGGGNSSSSSGGGNGSGSSARDGGPAYGFYQNPLLSATGNKFAMKDLAGLTKVDGLSAVVVMTWCFSPEFCKRYFKHLLDQSVDTVLVHSQYGADEAVGTLWGQSPGNMVALDPTAHLNVGKEAGQKGTMHHAKGFILFCPASVRVIVSTANLSSGDCFGPLSNAWWYQDFPLKKKPGSARDGEPPPKSEFEYALLMYLESVLASAKKRPNDSASVQACLAKMGECKKGLLFELARYDFSGALARLLVSIPRKPGTGAAMLQRVMEPIENKSALPLVMQSSSIGSQGKGNDFIVRVLATAMGQPQRGKVSVVWPLESYCTEVHGKMGVHPCSLGVELAEVPELRSQFKRWIPDDSRGRTTPHQKTYCGHNPRDPRTLVWCILSSANMSQAAWGSGTSPPSNYELGVYFGPGLEATEGKVFVTRASGADNEIVLPLGYQIDAPAYETSDVPAGTNPKELTVLMKTWQKEQRELNAKRGETLHEPAEAQQQNSHRKRPRSQDGSFDGTIPGSSTGQSDDPICLDNF